MACFVGADNLNEVLGDFTSEINWANTNEVVKKCAKLAHANVYKLFAMGKNGLCLSGADMRHKYYTSGTYGAYCKDGIGKGNSMFVYSLGKHCVVASIFNLMNLLQPLVLMKRKVINLVAGYVTNTYSCSASHMTSPKNSFLIEP